MLARHEYKVVPAPRTPAKVRGVRGDEARFALAVEEAINVAAAEGWEYVRSERLPCEHRGWFSRRTDEQTLMVFRRDKDQPTAVAGIAPSVKHVEPRLAADRTIPRRTGSGQLRAAPVTGHDGDTR